MNAVPDLTEAQLQRNVIQLAKACGWKCYHPRFSVGSEPGWPDLVMAHRQRGFMFVELKSERGKLTDAQRDWLDTLTACGQDVRVWRPRDWDEICRVLGSRRLC